MLLAYLLAIVHLRAHPLLGTKRGKKKVSHSTESWLLLASTRSLALSLSPSAQWCVWRGAKRSNLSILYRQTSFSLALSLWHLTTRRRAVFPSVAQLLLLIVVPLSLRRLPVPTHRHHLLCAGKLSPTLHHHQQNHHRSTSQSLISSSPPFSSVVVLVHARL